MRPKHKLFADEYLIDMDAVRAYEKVYGCKLSTAKVNSYLLLENPSVSAYIEKEQKKLSTKMGITKESIAREFAHSGYDDIKNYLSFRTEKVFVGYDEDHKPIYDYRTIVDMKDSDTIDTRNIQEVSVGSKGEFKFKLYSKADALNALGKHLGMFTDKSEVKMTVTVEDYLKSLGSDEEEETDDD